MRAGRGHFLVDERDADPGDADMRLVGLRCCDRRSQLFRQVGAQCTEASALRDDRRSLIEHALGRLVCVQDARFASDDDHADIDAVERRAKCFNKIGFCGGVGAFGASPGAVRILVDPIRNDGHEILS